MSTIIGYAALVAFILTTYYFLTEGSVAIALWFVHRRERRADNADRPVRKDA